MVLVLLSAGTTISFGRSLAYNSKGPMKCLSLYNRTCQARPTLVDIISYKALFYPFNISVNKCGRSCNTIDDPYARVCVPKK